MALFIHFQLSDNGDENVRNKILQGLLWALVNINRRYLRAHPNTPSIYDSGVRFIREEPGKFPRGVVWKRNEPFEQWADIGQVIEQGGADCEDLVCWRVAELLECGIPARPAWQHREIEIDGTGKRGRLYHILVHTPNGLEDPSRKLGMGVNEAEYA